jgi:hypothetical protein
VGIYKTRLNVRSLELSKQMNQEEVRASIQDVVRDTKKLYYQIQQKESSLQVSPQTLALYRELERIAGEYVLRSNAWTVGAQGSAYLGSGRSDFASLPQRASFLFKVARCF